MKLFIFSVILLLSKCVPYKVGNLEILNFPIKSNLREKLVRNYIDTLIIKHGFRIPQKLEYLDKMVDMDSDLNVRIYFNQEPKEMYLISFGGTITLSDVYNPKIKDWDWIGNEKNLPAEEKTRILARFDKEVLKVIYKMAVENKTPDSLLYVPIMFRYEYNIDTVGYGYYRKTEPNCK
jgi:hypothetical protein